MGSAADFSPERPACKVLVTTLIAARQVQGALISQQDSGQLLTRDERCLLWNGSGATLPRVARYIRHGESL